MLHPVISTPQVFKLDWVIMSIVILCVIAMLLYGAAEYAKSKI